MSPWAGNRTHSLSPLGQWFKHSLGLRWKKLLPLTSCLVAYTKWTGDLGLCIQVSTLYDSLLLVTPHTMLHEVPDCPNRDLNCLASMWMRPQVLRVTSAKCGCRRFFSGEVLTRERSLSPGRRGWASRPRMDSWKNAVQQSPKAHG